VGGYLRKVAEPQDAGKRKERKWNLLVAVKRKRIQEEWNKEIENKK
jgi:hypothetical protein